MSNCCGVCDAHNEKERMQKKIWALDLLEREIYEDKMALRFQLLKNSFNFKIISRKAAKSNLNNLNAAEKKKLRKHLSGIINTLQGNATRRIKELEE